VVLHILIIPYMQGRLPMDIADAFTFRANTGVVLPMVQQAGIRFHAPGSRALFFRIFSVHIVPNVYHR